MLPEPLGVLLLFTTVLHPSALSKVCHLDTRDQLTHVVVFRGNPLLELVPRVGSVSEDGCQSRKRPLVHVRRWNNGKLNVGFTIEAELQQRAHELLTLYGVTSPLDAHVVALCVLQQQAFELQQCFPAQHAHYKA